MGLAHKPLAPPLASDAVSIGSSAYIAEGVSVGDLQRAAERWARDYDSRVGVDVEPADDYPGFVTAVDVYLFPDSAQALAVRDLVRALRNEFPGTAIENADDLDAALAGD